MGKYICIFKWSMCVLWLVCMLIIQVLSNWKVLGVGYLACVFFAAFCILRVKEGNR